MKEPVTLHREDLDAIAQELKHQGLQPGVEADRALASIASGALAAPVGHDTGAHPWTRLRPHRRLGAEPIAALGPLWLHLHFDNMAASVTEPSGVVLWMPTGLNRRLGVWVGRNVFVIRHGFHCSSPWRRVACHLASALAFKGSPVGQQYRSNHEPIERRRTIAPGRGRGATVKAGVLRPKTDDV